LSLSDCEKIINVFAAVNLDRRIATPSCRDLFARFYWIFLSTFEHKKSCRMPLVATQKRDFTWTLERPVFSTPVRAAKLRDLRAFLGTALALKFDSITKGRMSHQSARNLRRTLGSAQIWNQQGIK